MKIHMRFCMNLKYNLWSSKDCDHSFCSFLTVFSLDHQVNAKRVPDGKSCVACMGRKGNDYTILAENLVVNIAVDME